MTDKEKIVNDLIENNPDSGYYVARFSDENGNKLIGNSYGPMNRYRYITMDEFYDRITKMK